MNPHSAKTIFIYPTTFWYYTGICLVLANASRLINIGRHEIAIFIFAHVNLNSGLSYVFIWVTKVHKQLPPVFRVLNGRNISGLSAVFPSLLKRPEKRFTEPRVVASREFEVLQSLQKRMALDLQQSEIILNYLTAKYGEPAKKRAKSSSQ